MKFFKLLIIQLILITSICLNAQSKSMVGKQFVNPEKFTCTYVGNYNPLIGYVSFNDTHQKRMSTQSTLSVIFEYQGYYMLIIKQESGLDTKNGYPCYMVEKNILDEIISKNRTSNKNGDQFFINAVKAYNSN